MSEFIDFHVIKVPRETWNMLCQKPVKKNNTKDVMRCESALCRALRSLLMPRSCSNVDIEELSLASDGSKDQMMPGGSTGTFAWRKDAIYINML